jgi:hypothetical protein
MALLPVLAKSRPAANPSPGRVTPICRLNFKLRDRSPRWHGSVGHDARPTLSSVRRGKSRPVGSDTAGRGALLSPLGSVSAQLNLVDANRRSDAVAAPHGRTLGSGRGNPPTCRTPDIDKDAWPRVGRTGAYKTAKENPDWLRNPDALIGLERQLTKWGAMAVTRTKAEEFRGLAPRVPSNGADLVHRTGPSRNAGDGRRVRPCGSSADPWHRCFGSRGGGQIDDEIKLSGLIDRGVD